MEQRLGDALTYIKTHYSFGNESSMTYKDDLVIVVYKANLSTVTNQLREKDLVGLAKENNTYYLLFSVFLKDEAGKYMVTLAFNLKDDPSYLMQLGGFTEDVTAIVVKRLKRKITLLNMNDSKVSAN